MEKMVRMAVSLILVASVVLPLGCTTRMQPAKPVARVNDVELTEDDLAREMRHTNAFYMAQHNLDLNAPENADLLATARTEALERIIDQELVRQIAEGLFPADAGGKPIVTVSDEEVQAAAQEYEAQAGSREELLKQNGFESYTEFLDFVRGNLRVDKLANVYGLGEQVQVRHIMVATQEEAQQVLARLQAGEDFAQVAQEVSLDRASAENGGDLGWFGRDVMVPSFEEAAFSLAEGQISDIIQTQYGFHILQLLGKRVSVDAMVFQTWFMQIKGQAKIERLSP